MQHLMKKPGEWALVKTFTRPRTAERVAGDLRRGRTEKPPGRWEFESRRLEDGTSGLWARYLGPRPVPDFPEIKADEDLLTTDDRGSYPDFLSRPSTAAPVAEQARNPEEPVLVPSHQAESR